MVNERLQVVQVKTIYSCLAQKKYIETVDFDLLLISIFKRQIKAAIAKKQNNKKVNKNYEILTVKIS